MLSADSSAKDITVPRGLLEALRPQIEALGENLPGFDRIVPKVDLDLGVREMGMQLGGMLKNCGLYRKGISRRLVAMFSDEGWKEMTPHRFPGWVEKFVTCYKNHRGGKGGYYMQETSMGKDLAAKVLETDDFLVQIPIIEHVVNVRAPVLRKDGKIELLRPGYDHDSQIWCDDAVPYRLDMTPAEAIDVINEFCCEFPYADMKQPFKKHAWTNRSFLVHVAGMLGVFNRFLLSPGVIRPLMMYFSNDQGSGKSIQVAMSLASLYGIAGNTDLPSVGTAGSTKIDSRSA
ncbi:hypothetical protein [Verrucomicrobium spinosum]|uniref:hypothetical protein n=1 Tax=Verrucomicrobium spinosum TaxID=2736 RepID=UPI000946126E|nr:hypothetical protein [Verrucomicrobium spinosum]